MKKLYSLVFYLTLLSVPLFAQIIHVKPSSSNDIISPNLISLTGKIISTNNYAQYASQQSVKFDLSHAPPYLTVWMNKENLTQRS